MEQRQSPSQKKAELALQYTLIALRSSSPVKDLASKLGHKPGVMAQWVKALRAEGYLTPTVQGRAGGRITKQTADILGIPFGAEALDPPFKIGVKLEAQTKREMIYQLRQLIKDVEAM